MPEAATTRTRDNELHQDLGTILTIVLTSPTAALLIRELSRWAARRYDATVHLSRTDTGESVDMTGPLTARHERMLQQFLAGDDRA
ncbi:hypothetical protein ACIA8C_24040 [Nocardia sp. NPDC051321]|uniref:hypothetical protein n=1 Tax=Nocardia sp. NPDC051321 TaxID=3364323 RepID=UPI00379A6C1E